MPYTCPEFIIRLFFCHDFLNQFYSSNSLKSDFVYRYVKEDLKHPSFYKQYPCTYNIRLFEPLDEPVDTEAVLKGSKPGKHREHNAMRINNIFFMCFQKTLCSLCSGLLLRQPPSGSTKIRIEQLNLLFLRVQTVGNNVMMNHLKSTRGTCLSNQLKPGASC